jgi:arylformamidase
MPVHDISAPLRPDLPTWPGEAGLRRELVSDLSEGNDATVSRLTLGAHTGTHIDAPSHFLPDGAAIEAVDPDVLVGPVEVVGLEHLRGPITSDDLDALRIPDDTQRLLAKTANSGWSAEETSFRKDFVAFESSGAQWCVDRGVRLVGIDYLSIEPFGSGQPGHPVHKILLGAGVVVIEGLDLVDVAPGRYQLAALPLLIPGGEGAPARVVLVE